MIARDSRRVGSIWLLAGLCPPEEVLEPKQLNLVGQFWICPPLDRPKYAAILCVEAAGGRVRVLRLDLQFKAAPRASPCDHSIEQRRAHSPATRQGCDPNVPEQRQV